MFTTCLSDPASSSCFQEKRPSGQGRHADGPVSFRVIFPWMTWLCLIGADVWFICRFGTNAPFQNEWRLVPATFGQAPSDYSSLSQLVLTFFYRISGPDFRAGMLASLAFLAGLAAAMMMASRSVRGRPDWSDAVYPLLLLHWGHAGTLLISGQLHVALVTALAGAILVIIAYDAPTVRSAPAPLPGGEGRTGSTFLAGGEGRKWGAILICIGLLIWSSGELRGQTSFGSEPGRWLRSAMDFVALGVGLVGRQWPVAMGGLITLGFIAGVNMLVTRWLKQPGERGRLFGLLAWAGGFALLALCDLPQGQWRRPVTLAALGPCWIMMVLAIYGRSTFARFVPRLATLAALALLWPWPVAIEGAYPNIGFQTNTSQGLEQAQALKKQFEAMRSDIEAGLPEMVLVYRFSRLPNLAEGLALLRDHKIGMFSDLRPNPDCERVPAGRVARTPGRYHFDFAGGKRVYGAWIKVEPTRTSQPVTLEMSWKRLHGLPSSGSDRTRVASHAEDALVWIDETIVEADIQCDGKAVRSLSVDFLVPRLATSGGVR